MADNKFLLKLSQNLLECLEDNEYYDVTIEVGKDPYVKVFRAHMIILYYRSSYLQRVLSANKKKNDETLVHIKLPNILPESFHIILRYIYGAKLSLEEYNTSDIINILVAASDLGLQELVIHLQSFLIENKATWMEQNFNLINQTSFKHNSFLELQKFCNNLMSKEPEKIFKSVDFVTIPEKSLVSIIQNENLSTSDVQVWEHVLKWGIAQTPEISSDPSEYTKDDFNTLKNTLQHCIPFIGFYNFTSKEFLHKVLPYKKVLPKELYTDLNKYFLDNDYIPKSRITKMNRKLINFNSKIITVKHAELISKWINRIDVKHELKNPYIFKLLFRGSRDGFTYGKFHELCDNITRTVTIIKVKDSDEILGGYNPIDWNVMKYLPKITKERYGATKESFIFSFKNKLSTENCILSRVNYDNRAISKWNHSGPSFGWKDLVVYGDEGLCIKDSYKEEIREIKEFFIEEYEVFQIMQI